MVLYYLHTAAGVAEGFGQHGALGFGFYALPYERGVCFTTAVPCHGYSPFTACYCNNDPTLIPRCYSNTMVAVLIVGSEGYYYYCRT